MKYFFSVMVALICYAAQSTDLSLKLKVGETYTQNYVSDVEMNQSINGMDQVIKMKVESGMNFTVREATDKGYRMGVAYSKLVMDMSLPTGEMVFSSESDAEDLVTAIMKGLVGKEFEVTILKNGSISEVKNMDAIFTGMAASFPNVPEAQKEQVMAQLRKSYGENAFKGNIEMITAIFPDKDVNIGDSWKNTVKMESGFNGMVSNQFTLEEITSDQIVVKGDSQLNTQKESTVVNGGMPTKYDLSGTMKSSYTLDPVTNWIVSGSVSQDISGTISIEDNPNLPGGISFPMTMVSTLTIGQ